MSASDNPPDECHVHYRYGIAYTFDRGILASSRSLMRRTMYAGRDQWILRSCGPTESSEVAPVAHAKPPELCGWIIDGDAAMTCDRKATRGTQITGPLCDEHGEEDQRESEEQ